MNASMSRQVVLLVLCTALVPGCARKASREIDPGKALEEVDSGTVENGVYRNKYFGMSITIPPDWSIPDRASMKEIVKAGGRVVSGDNQKLKTLTKAAELQSVNLFAASKHPAGSAVVPNPSVICMAERVRHMPGIKRGRDYHFHFKRLLEASPLEVKFPKDVFSETLNGVEFDILCIEISMPTMTIKQEQYVAIIRGYALGLGITYTTEEEKSSLKEILNSVSFE